MTQPALSVVQRTYTDIPHSEAAEKAVLGSLMIAPENILAVASRLQDSSDFYLLRHRVIFEAMLAAYNAHKRLDSLILADYMESTGDLSTIGGRAYLTQLANDTPTSQNLPVYTALVARTAARRRAIEAADNIRSLYFDESLDIASIQDQAHELWLKARFNKQGQRGQGMAQAMSKFYDDFEMAMQSDTRRGLTIGLTDVDKMLGGLLPGQFIVLAARTGVGKSSAMDQMALHMAKQNPVYYATSERSVDNVLERMVSMVTGIESHKIRNPQDLEPEQAARVTKAMADISQLPIYFDDDPNPTVQDLHTRFEMHGDTYKVLLFDGMYRSRTGIDSLDNGQSGHAKYGRIAYDLKTLANSLGVPVVTTHQLNRSLESRQNKRPMLSDLRESGRIEEEADKVLFLYRDVMYNPNTEYPNACEWIISKHRNGAMGTVTTYYEDKYTRFHNMKSQRVVLD